ncbi:uncharacterized protein LOC127461327 [Manacus candei]|uniref:uncharacterized protein LOC127461327 n=1 Tax=Manacus candei TaxID=415023 RepID=UPI0022261DD0|nr:uncharacterized protein LOC127461327 [Manacus candei]
MRERRGAGREQARGCRGGSRRAGHVPPARTVGSLPLLLLLPWCSAPRFPRGRASLCRGFGAGGGGAAAKSGEERLKEMEAEMALFEQEVLGAPGPAPGDPLAPPPILRPIIATNTYQQVSSNILGGASGLLPAVIPAPALEYRAKTQGMLRACSSPALGCATSTQLLLGSSLQPSTGGFSSARGPLLVESSRSSCNNSPSPIPASGDVSLELPLFYGWLELCLHLQCGGIVLGQDQLG